MTVKNTYRCRCGLKYTDPTAYVIHVKACNHKRLAPGLAFSLILALALLALTSIASAQDRSKVISRPTLAPPVCNQQMEAGTVCRWIPLSQVTLVLTQTGVVNPVKTTVAILTPRGLRGISALVNLEISGTDETCSPTTSMFFEGFGGVSVDCQ